MDKEFNKYKLPKNWIWVELGDVLETTSGGTPSRGRPDYYNGTIPWVKSGELNYNIITKTEEYITDAALQSSSAKLFPKGTLLIALYGATVGRLAFLGINASTNQAVCGIFQNRNIDTKYIYYCLMNQYSYLISQSAGGAQPNISQTILKKVNIPLAPLNEQNRIVEKLDELLSELEKGKEQLQTSLEQLKVYRQSILKHAFEGRLSEEWRNKQKKLKNPDELVAEIKEYRNQQYEIQLKEYKEGKTIVKPKHPKDIIIITRTFSDYSGWVLSKLGDVFETASGGTPSRNNPRYYSGNIPWVKSGELKYNIIIDTEERVSKEAIENSSAKLFPKGTLLIALYGATVGKLAFLGIEASTNQAVCGIYEEPYYDHKFLYYYLMFMRPELLNQSTGGAQPNISQTILSNLPVPLCSKEEQLLVVEQINKLFSLNDEIKKTIEENLMKSDALKQGLLQNAFEGKLIDQNPTDEPASVLLERIKKEREEFLKSEKEKKKSQEKPMKKKSAAKVFEFPLIDTIKDKFGKKSFTFEQLKSEVDINYDDLREELFKLLDNEKLLAMEFDQKKESMSFKYLGQ